jgi:hypothetical protein
MADSLGSKTAGSRTYFLAGRRPLGLPTKPKLCVVLPGSGRDLDQMLNAQAHLLAVIIFIFTAMAYKIEAILAGVHV